ncbi:helix-turn-helix domain-containing protein [Streptomyces uncialis]|uniref:helix-turn-helix domain-containing protein n=1 Tax=Streptomyces uncialis TaxID=1048205 RepID=UPI002E30974D|nr:helix-turn-helix transcriptional regulator [Streptomyces uncialis]
MEISRLPAEARRRRSSEIRAFLRSRRSRLTPEEVGMPSGGGRRSPGLRREEVAVLAGVGVSWYTWLEQGRAINVSAGVLELSHACCGSLPPSGNISTCSPGRTRRRHPWGPGRCLPRCGG